MKTREVVERLGIKKPTLFKYLDDFKMNISRKENNELDFTDEDVSFLEKVVKLREADNGINTIKNILGNVYELSDIVSDEELERYSKVDTMQEEDLVVDEILLERIEEIETNILHIGNKIDNLVDLVKQNGENMYKLGKLETQLASEREKFELFNKSHLNDISVLQKELQKKDLENNNISNKLEELTQELSREKGKSLLNRVVGK